MKFKQNTLATAAGLFVVALTTVSQAQPVLEEVIVTAQKKVASVNDVPITVTAISNSDIKNLRLTDAMDVESYVTNIDIKGTLGGTNPAITVRGVGLNDFNANNNPAVGVYVDEVFLVSAGMLNFSTFDTERVEVLKGPQGTLYGRNTNGGAINYFTIRPGFEANGYVELTAGDYDLLGMEGAYGDAINENWAYRISGKLSEQGENYIDNELGDDFDGSELATSRLALRYQADRLLFDTSVTVGSQKIGFTPFKNRGFVDPNDLGQAPCLTAATGNPAQDSSCTSVLLGVDTTFFNVDNETFPNQDAREATYATNIDTPETETDSLLWFARFDYELSDNGTITSVTSYGDVDRNYADSVFGSLQGYHYFDADRGEKIKQFSQELRYAYSNDNIVWTSGVFYSYDEISSSNITNALDSLATTYDIRYDQETTAAAAFSQLTYALTETWSVELGLRYSWEERKFEGGTTDLNPADQSVILYLPVEDDGFGLLPAEFSGPLSLTAGTKIDFDDDDISGRLGLSYRPNDDWLIYGTVSSGYKSGIVFSDITFTPEEMGPLDSETLYAYELGFKGTMAGGSLQLNGAIFYYDYDDIQTQVPTELSLAFTNADGADIQGAELDVNWLPHEGLSLRIGVSYLDTEFNDPALDGNELPNAPEVQYNVIARYEVFMDNGLGLAFQADMKYTDKMYKEATNNPLAQTDDYTLVNGRISLLGADEKWEVAIWGKNLSDEDYLEHVFVVDFFGITGDLYNTPRTYGASLTYNF